MVGGHAVGLSLMLVLVLTGCYVGQPPPPVGPQSSMYGQPTGAPYGQPTGAPYGQQAGAPIDAGCSFTANELPGGGAPGATYQIGCPAGCGNTGGLWGTDVYTSDSSICRAGIHAGAISPGGGVVTLQTQPGLPAYRGSARNGIQSSDYGAYRQSYAVLGGGGGGGANVAVGLPAGYPPPSPQSYYPAQPAAPARPAGGAIEAGCSFTSRDINDVPGAMRVVNCPAGCASHGGLWGTDVYTGDSAICRAAIHAGLISPDGGNVAVILEAGRPAYRGSVRYGIQSSDYGAYGSSYRLQRP